MSVFGEAIAPTVYVLGQQHTPVSKTDADTNEAVLYSLLIPAGTLGPNDTIYAQLIAALGAPAVVRTLRLRFNGTQALLYGQASANFNATPLWTLRNRNSLVEQVGTPDNTNGVAGGVGTIPLPAIDFSVDQLLTITGQWGSSAGGGANSITLHSVVVSIMKGV